jgi:hypothetical protein
LTFIEDGFKDCCDDMADVQFKDGFYDDTDLGIKDWSKEEKDKYNFAVGHKEQMSLATKSVKILANIRNDI